MLGTCIPSILSIWYIIWSDLFVLCYEVEVRYLIDFWTWLDSSVYIYIYEKAKLEREGSNSLFLFLIFLSHTHSSLIGAGTPFVWNILRYFLNNWQNHCDSCLRLKVNYLLKVVNMWTNLTCYCLTCTFPCENYQDEAVQKVVEFMNIYSISQEDFDTIVELSKFKVIYPSLMMCQCHYYKLFSVSS